MCARWKYFQLKIEGRESRDGQKVVIIFLRAFFCTFALDLGAFSCDATNTPVSF